MFCSVLGPILQYLCYSDANDMNNVATGNESLIRNCIIDNSNLASPLDRFLVERSGLTSVQVETIELQKRVEKSEISGSKAASMRRPKGVTPGAYYRVLTQAKSNVEEAIYTLLLADSLGLLQIEDFRRLLELISKTPRSLDEAEASEVVSVVDALVRRIVML